MKVIITLLIFFVVNSINAQHCGWDNSYMVYIKVVDSTNKPINNLKLTLLDSLNNPVVKIYNKLYMKRYKEYITNDTLQFNQYLLDHDKSFSDHNERHLKVAGRNYYLLFPAEFLNKATSYKIKIEDATQKYYTTIQPIEREMVFNLCYDYSKKDWDDKLISSTLKSKTDILFTPLKIITTIIDKNKINDLIKKTDFPTYKNYFISRYIDNENTNFIGLFKKVGNKYLVYCLTYNTDVNTIDFKNNTLSFIEETRFASKNHYEAENFYNYVDLNKLKKLSFKCYSREENWSDDENTEMTIETCESKIVVNKSIFTITKTCSPNYNPGFENDCIDKGQYKIVNNKFVKF